MKKKLKLILCLILLPFPWIIRKLVFKVFFGYHFNNGSYIGRSIILVDELKMGKNSRIKSYNFINDIDLLFLGDYAQIDSRNWITGLSTKYKTNFTFNENRHCFLKLGTHARITNLHHFDCTGGVDIGDFTTVAGLRSVFLTHEIDIDICRQKAEGLSIGKYCFISTNCILLMGSSISDYSLLAAGSVLTKKYTEPYLLLGGVPAKKIKELNKQSAYFSRQKGHVN